MNQEAINFINNKILIFKIFNQYLISKLVLQNNIKLNEKL